MNIPPRHRYTAAAALAAMLALLVSACSSDGSTSSGSSGSKSGGTKVSKLAYIVKYGTVPYFVQENKGVQQRSKALGITTTTTDVEQDANAALSAVDTAIGQGAQGILTVVPDQKIGPAVLSKAKAAHIPVIALDDPIKDSDGNAAPFVGFDAAQLGTQVGTSLAELMTKAGVTAGPDLKIASIEDQKTPVCMTRNRAAQAALFAKMPGLSDSNVLHVPYNNDLNSGIDAMNPVATANPSVKTWVVYSCNDAGVLGAWRALSQHGVAASSVYGVGIGGEYACQEFSKGAASGFRASYYTDSAIHGATGVQELYDFISKGTPIPARTILPGKFVDPSHFKQVVGC